MQTVRELDVVFRVQYDVCAWASADRQIMKLQAQVYTARLGRVETRTRETKVQEDAEEAKIAGGGMQRRGLNGVCLARRQSRACS